jgi:hypothetical protein
MGATDNNLTTRLDLQEIRHGVVEIFEHPVRGGDYPHGAITSLVNLRLHLPRVMSDSPRRDGFLFGLSGS